MRHDHAIASTEEVWVEKEASTFIHRPYGPELVYSPPQKRCRDGENPTHRTLHNLLFPMNKIISSMPHSRLMDCYFPLQNDDINSQNGQKRAVLEAPFAERLSGRAKEASHNNDSDLIYRDTG